LIFTLAIYKLCSPKFNFVLDAREVRQATIKLQYAPAQMQAKVACNHDV